MKASLRAKRMAKHHRRMGSITKLNLVSLMDIFTILVFFLLINSSDVEILSADKSIELPESVASQKPDTTLLIKVNRDSLVVGNYTIANIETLAASDKGATITLLEAELKRQAQRRPATEREQQKGRAVTIMGDQAVPYHLLKRIMASCAATGSRDISLAVNQRAASAQGAVSVAGAAP